MSSERKGIPRWIEVWGSIILVLSAMGWMMTRLEARIDRVEDKLVERIDRVEDKLSDRIDQIAAEQENAIDGVENSLNGLRLILGRIRDPPDTGSR